MSSHISSTSKPSFGGTDLIEDYLAEIDELESQAAPLREERDRLNEESRKWIEKRNSLNGEIMRLRDEAFSCKDKRDKLNETVQELKAKREEAKRELAAKREQIASITARIRGLEPKPTLDERAARKRLRELDWRIQTTTLSMAEEKRVLSDVKSLELELAIHEEIKKQKNEASRLFSEVDGLRSTIEKYHGDLSRSAKTSQECHEQMMSSLHKADQLSKEAETTHQTFVEFKRKADDLHKSYSSLISRIKEIERQIREIDENVHREQIRKALESREKVSKAAQEKLQTGEKLTFEEFKILIERGEV